MTPEQIDLVQSSFQKVKPVADQLSDVFYARIFETAPVTRRLFQANLDKQRDKLFQMLLWLVKNLHRIETILPAVQELGRRHQRYEVEASNYNHVGEALIYALHKTLGESFTPELRKAWIAVYSLVARTMQDAASAPITGDIMPAAMLDGSLVAVYGATVADEAKDEDQRGWKTPQPEKIDKASIFKKRKPMPQLRFGTHRKY